MMHMTFYWGKKVTLLIDLWRTDSWTGYSLTLLACLVVAVFYQYLENHRIHLWRLSSAKPVPTGAPIQTPLLERKLVGVHAKLGIKTAGSILFGFSSAIGYLLMLSVMSFNGGILLSVVLGLAIGYYLFRSGYEEASVIVENSCACS